MNIRIYNLQLEETQKPDTPKEGKESEFKKVSTTRVYVKSRMHVSHSIFEPRNSEDEPYTATPVAVKESKRCCVIM